LEVKVSNFFAKINYPVLADLKLDMSDVETDLVYPHNLPDLFRGTQLTFIGRYRNPVDMDNVRLLLTGTSNGKARSFFYNNLHFPLREEKNDFLPRLWATRRVGWLMEQIRTNGEQKELRDEVVDLGTRYGIVTPYTSYLALEPNAAVRDVTSLPMNGRRLSGVAGGIGNAPPPSPKMDPNAITGMAGVQQSKRARAQQETVRVEEKDAELSSAVKTVGGKTFYLREGVWTDAEFKAEAHLRETALTFGSDDYFALLKQKPSLAQFFSLGERVIVVFEGRVYRVTTTKP
jgi:Ca-activated chloride channel family protein